MSYYLVIWANGQCI